MPKALARATRLVMSALRGTNSMWATCLRRQQANGSIRVPVLHGRAAPFGKDVFRDALKSCIEVVARCCAAIFRRRPIPGTDAALTIASRSGRASPSSFPLAAYAASPGLTRRSAARANVMAAGRSGDGMEVGAGAPASPRSQRAGVAGYRCEGLGVKENPSRPAASVTFCIATLNLASYSEDKGERKVNCFLRSGADEREGRIEGNRMRRRGRSHSVFCVPAVRFRAPAPRDSCNDGKVIVNGHA